MFAGFLMATIFGGIHCMAWFFAFPTNLERLLWRISAVAITCTPCLEILFTLVGRTLEWDIIIVTIIISALLYVVSRVMLLVLMFTTLRHLPLHAYMTVSWISLVPHL
ncbi:hypothetical protein DEU56DRAFT_213958 [Suillus clintonianus]|uniref:uncharacterized protein n=1 Tax=Suillus clintonianus TaxID=1904413 RepID=UPI001B877AC8|nr:uncharacterized protein DEU56DRAFT_213958 [Suillus clintonianus]KAG2111469.1 hypothetical protein DEU56DRAFT_213958 [Suillus clintonianus]